MTRLNIFQKIIVSIAIGLALLGAATIGYFLVWPVAGSIVYSTSFDSSEWKDTMKVFEPTDWPVRLRMVDNLLADKRLIGLTYKEVIDLLGKPDDFGYFEKHSLVYWLGPERGFIRIDSEWLVIDLGPDSVVTRAAIMRD